MALSSILTSKDLDDIHSTVHGILKDESIGSITIGYRMSGTTVSDFDPTTQLIPSMFAFTDVSAFKGGYGVEEIKGSGGLIEMGDVKFILMLSSVTGVLSVDDRIYESGTTFQAGSSSGTTYEIKSIDKDPLNLCYFIQARIL